MAADALLAVAFVAAGALSLAAAAVFVVRLERVGARLGLSEAILGLLAALGADAPEITSSVTALANHQGGVAAGVVLGASVFNLVTLFGIGALVSRRIHLRRRVVVLAGFPALCVAAVTTGLEHKSVPVLGAALVVVGFLVPYTALLEAPQRVIALFRLRGRAARALRWAVADDERDLATVIAPRRAGAGDVAVAVAMLVVVVAASAVTERLGSSIGARAHWPAIVVGGIVLAGVTSVPNAVAAIYLARNGRGAAAVSTAFHSNTINVVAGLIIPTLFVAGGPSASVGAFLSSWYLGLTVLVVLLAYARRGLTRLSGIVVLCAYAGFLAALAGS